MRRTARPEIPTWSRGQPIQPPEVAQVAQVVQPAPPPGFVAPAAFVVNPRRYDIPPRKYYHKRIKLTFLALPVGPYVELEMLESFNDIIPQIEPIPIAVVPASAVAIAPGMVNP